MNRNNMKKLLIALILVLWAVPGWCVTILTHTPEGETTLVSSGIPIHAWQVDTNIVVFAYMDNAAGLIYGDVYLRARNISTDTWGSAVQLTHPLGGDETDEIYANTVAIAPLDLTATPDELCVSAGFWFTDADPTYQMLYVFPFTVASDLTITLGGTPRFVDYLSTATNNDAMATVVSMGTNEIGVVLAVDWDCDACNAVIDDNLRIHATNSPGGNALNAFDSGTDGCVSGDPCSGLIYDVDNGLHLIPLRWTTACVDTTNNIIFVAWSNSTLPHPLYGLAVKVTLGAPNVYAVGNAGAKVQISTGLDNYPGEASESVGKYIVVGPMDSGTNRAICGFTEAWNTSGSGCTGNYTGKFYLRNLTIAAANANITLEGASPTYLFGARGGAGAGSINACYQTTDTAILFYCDADDNDYKGFIIDGSGTSSSNVYGPFTITASSIGTNKHTVVWKIDSLNFGYCYEDKCHATATYGDSNFGTVRIIQPSEIEGSLDLVPGQGM